MLKPLIFNISSATGVAQGLAEAVGGEIGDWESRRFPDDEIYFRFCTEVTDRPVLLLCSLDRPDEKVLTLIFAASTARSLGAHSVGLVCPYLAYMRQDTRFNPGEAVTSKTFAGLVSAHVDWLVTLDPHLHRYDALSDIYTVPSKLLHAAPAVAHWISLEVENPLLIGPDSESAQWVKSVADLISAPFRVLEKTRRGDHAVSVSVPDVENCKDHTPVIVDDIVSTAKTMIETVKHLMEAALKPPVCVAVHGLFTGTAYGDLKASGVKHVISTNTIAHESNGIDITAILTEGVETCLAGKFDAIT